MILSPTISKLIYELSQVAYHFRDLGLVRSAEVRTIEIVPNDSVPSDLAILYKIGGEKDDAVNYHSLVVPVTESSLITHITGLSAAQEVALDKLLENPENSKWLMTTFKKWENKLVGKLDKNGTEIKAFDVFSESSDDGPILNIVYFDKEENAFKALMWHGSGSFPLTDFDSEDIEIEGNLKNESDYKEVARLFPDIHLIGDSSPSAVAEELQPSKPTEPVN